MTDEKLRRWRKIFMIATLIGQTLAILALLVALSNQQRTIQVIGKHLALLDQQIRLLKNRGTVVAQQGEPR